MDDGIDNQLDPGEPEERNIYEAIKDGKDVKKLPMSLGEALDAPRKQTKWCSVACRARCTAYITSIQVGRMGALYVHRHRLGQGNLYGMPALKASMVGRAASWPAAII